MSKASDFAAKAKTYIGMRYGLGEEGKYVVGPEQTSILDIDCSGLLYALCRDCGVLYKGKSLWRDTADGYWKLVTKKLAGPERIGDCCWFPKTGRKTHIAIYIGGGRTIEAGYHGPNNAYPGAHYVGTCTIAQMNARGAVWGRIEGLDIYDEEDDMDQATFDRMADDWAKRNVVTTYAPDLKEAVDGCAELGLLETKHAGGRPITTSLFRVALWRLAKKAGL